jgi:hypothetical protein
VANRFHFHVNLFAAPPASTFFVTWEEAGTQLERLPRMIFELDGSFVISGDDADGHRWQVDGHLFDFDGHLHRVELHGQCPPTAFDELLRCFGWPSRSLLFEMVREGAKLNETEFRRSIGAADGPVR